MKFKIFISSVQDEFANERRRLKDWLKNDPFVSRFVESVFIFEDVSSRGISPIDVYLEKVESSDIYILLVGSQYYGRNSVKRGKSATEKEYAAARECGIECWVYVANSEERDKKESDFLKRVSEDVTWSSYEGFPELRDAVFGSVIDLLDKKKLITSSDFDREVCAEATIDDLSQSAIDDYVEKLHAQGKKSIPQGSPASKLLKHLGMLKGRYLTNAGLLLFGRNPQSIYYQATLKCAWIEGTKYSRPFLDTAKYEGDLFSLLEMGKNFVLSRMAESRGIRDQGSIAPTKRQIPVEAIEEAVVNALVHRNWRSSASVEIRLFADRLEVCSPGHLPPDITIPELYEDHDSHPVNKEILKAFDKINVIESLGTGIERMISACKKVGLPTPVFEYRGSAFVVTLHKDRWTVNQLKSLGLNNRQIGAVSIVKTIGSISTGQYIEQFHVPRRTAARDLAALVSSGVLIREGAGVAAKYQLQMNCAGNEPNVPCDGRRCKSHKKGVKSKCPTEDTTQKIDAVLESTTQKSNDAAVEDLTGTARTIAGLMLARPEITTEELARVLKMTRDGINYQIKQLKVSVGLCRVGGRKNGAWRIGSKI